LHRISRLPILRPMVWKTRYGAGAVLTYRALIDPMIHPLRPRIVRICRELDAQEVLDIACGTGAQCRMLGRTGMQATGLDLAETMINAAHRLGGENTHYVIGSACELPFEDSSFDACLLLLALHEHPEEERSLMVREALRVLRPIGALIVADFTRPKRPTLHVPWQVIRFIENTAGEEHNAGFRDFVAQGCLDGLIKRHGLALVSESSSHFGTIGIAVIRCKADRTAESITGVLA